MFKISERKVMIMILLVAALILLLPQLYREKAFDGNIIGDTSYYHMRLARQIFDDIYPERDFLSYGGRPYIFNPYHYLLASFSYLFGFSMASKILPFLLANLSLLLLWLLLKKANFAIEKRIIFSFLLLLSPAFLYSGTVSNSHIFFVSLFLLAIYLFLLDSSFLNVLSILFFCLIPFFGLLQAFLALLFLFSYCRKNKRRLQLAIALILIIAIAYSFFSNSPLLGFKAEFLEKNIIALSVTELGALIGFSIYSISLAGIGFFISWRNKYRYYPVYLAILVLLMVLKYFSSEVNILLNLFVTVLAAVSLGSILFSKWEFKMLKILTILILAIGIISSSFFYLIALSNSAPAMAEIKALEFLKSMPGKTVLSHYTNGFLVEYAADKAVVMDSGFRGIQEIDKIYSDTQEIFYSYSLKKTKELLDKHSVDYIFIDQDMKNNLVWTGEEQGLLFLFRNSETFNKIYDKDGVEIWLYLR